MPIILIVDDAIENIRLLKNLLQDFAQIVFATDGASALEQVGRHRPDLILLDVIMPGIDGHETCQRLKARPETRDIPVIFVTGAGSEEDLEKGLALGAVDYIVKPFSSALIRARVRNHLAHVGTVAALREANQSLQAFQAAVESNIAGIEQPQSAADVTRPSSASKTTDGITLRRRWMDAGEQEVQRSLQSKTPLSVLMLDIEQVKATIETNGQAAADAMIQSVAQACTKSAARVDMVMRLGDREFAVILPMTDRDGALAVAENIRMRVAEQRESTGVAIAVSISVAHLTSEIDDFAGLLGLAGGALYLAKSGGGHRVVSAN